MTMLYLTYSTNEQDVTPLGVFDSLESIMYKVPFEDIAWRQMPLSHAFSTPHYIGKRDGLKGNFIAKPIALNDVFEDGLGRIMP